MRISAQALLPLFLACVAFVLIAALWQMTGGNDFGDAATRRLARSRTSPAPAHDPSKTGAEGAHQALLRGRVVDAQTGEPVAALVTVICAQAAERQAQAGADGIFEVVCPIPVHATLAIPRTENHFGLVRVLDLGGPTPSLTLKLEPRRDLPVLLRTPDGRPLAEVVRPQGPWARETWPTILITQAPPTGRPSEGAPDPLLTTRVGRCLSSVHGDVQLRPGSPECCVGYVQLFQAPPASCSLLVGSRVLQTIVLDGHERQISLVVDPAELQDLHADMSLRVVDADTGLPPAARHGLWLGMLGGPASELAADLDEDGRVLIKDAPAGSVELYLRLGGYEHEVRRVDLHAGERNDIGELRVHAGACVAGHVVTETGEAVRARVWSSMRDGAEHPAGQASDTPEDADWFAIYGLPRATVLVGIDDPRWALNPVEVDLGRGSVQNESVVARKGTILRLVGPYSAAGAARLRVLDGRKLCVWKGDSLEQEVHELRLLPGHYTVEVQREGSLVSRQELDLGPAHDATIQLR